MEQHILFFRHGPLGPDGYLKPQGVIVFERQLERIAADVSFEPQLSVASPELACIRSAQHLSRGLEPHVVSSLYAMTTGLEAMLVDTTNWLAARDYAYARLVELGEIIQDRNAVVCTSDSVATFLALAWAERAGCKGVVWEEHRLPGEYLYLRAGAGFRVSGAEIKYYGY